MNNEYEMRNAEVETRCRHIYSDQKALRRPPGLTSPFEGQIAINSTCTSQQMYLGGFWSLAKYMLGQKLEIKVLPYHPF